MADEFYSSMAAMARDLLAPTSQGGLGQGNLVLHHNTIPEPDPDKPWEIPEPIVQMEVIRGAVKGVSEELIGKEVGGTVIVASDLVAICEVPQIPYTVGDNLYIDSDPMKIIDIHKIPAAGVTSAVRFILRG